MNRWNIVVDGVRFQISIKVSKPITVKPPKDHFAVTLGQKGGLARAKNLTPPIDV